MTFVSDLFIIEWGGGLFNATSSKSVYTSVSRRGQQQVPCGLSAVVYTSGRLALLVDSERARPGRGVGGSGRHRTWLSSPGPFQVAWEAWSWLTKTSSRVMSYNVIRFPFSSPQASLTVETIQKLLSQRKWVTEFQASLFGSRRVKKGPCYLLNTKLNTTQNIP